MSRLDLNSKRLLAALGAELRRQRKAKGLSQLALATRAEVHANVVGRIERGLYNPTILTLSAIADALDSSLAEVLLPKPARAKLKAI